MAQLPQGLGLDLADALPGHPKLPAHLLQGAAAAVLQATPGLDIEIEAIALLD